MAGSRKWRRWSGTAVLGLALISCTPLAAQRAETRLSPGDGTAGDRFGTAVAVRGDLLVAGAFQDDEQLGSAYVFERVGSAWVERAKLQASDRASFDEFGFTVAIGDQDTVFVGSRRNDAFGTDSGAVYVFERTGAGWAQTARLVALDATPGANFGAALAGDGTMLAVGAWGVSSLTGAAYVFERGAGGWTQVAKLTANPGAPSDTFGAGIGCSAGRIIVGAPGEDAGAMDSGAAFVFERTQSGWVQAARLKPVDLGSDDGFGLSVDLDGDRAIVGARGHQGHGATYLYERTQSGWAQVAKFVAGDVAPGDLFGHDVAIRGERVLVAARNATSQAGAAYVFARSGGVWSQAEKLVAGDSAPGDIFGQSVGLDGRIVVVGAWGDDAQRGSVYVLEAPSSIDAARSTLSATPLVLAAYGGTTATLVVDPRDASGARVPGPLAIAFASSAGTLLGTATAVGDGTWSQQLAPDARAASATITAHVDGVALTTSATVRFVAADLTTSTLEVAPEAIEVGRTATIMLTVRDDHGALVGRGGLVVAFATSAGTLVGPVSDLGDGRYTQQINGSTAATAALTASVDGLDLEDGAALSIQDPKIPASVVGVRGDGSFLTYKTIQSAVRSARRDGVRRILVPPGRYDEVVRLESCRALAIEGLVRYGRVVVRGFAVERSSGVTITGFEVDASATQRPGVLVSSSQNVVLQYLFVHGSTKSGMRLGSCSRGVVVMDCRVESCARHGVRIGAARGVELQRCALIGNGLCGALLEARAKVVIADSTIHGNGSAGDQSRGYGVLRERCGGRADPRDVTLRRNLVDGNHGRTSAGRSSAEFGNYDLMLDGSDEQVPF